MKENISRNLKKLKKWLIALAEALYEKGETAKRTIDFSVKASLYIYVALWSFILLWLLWSDRISKDELLPTAKQLLLDSEYLLPLSTLAVLLLVLAIVTFICPNIIKNKAGRVALFFLILSLFLYFFGRVVISLV